MLGLKHFKATSFRIRFRISSSESGSYSKKSGITSSYHKLSEARSVNPYIANSFSRALLGRSFAAAAEETASDIASSQLGRYLGYTLLLGGCGIATYYQFYGKSGKEEQHEEHVVTNWSNTHEAKTRAYYQPESLSELEEIVKLAHEKKQKIRPLGSGLSPNGIGLSDDGMINMALMDKVLDIDEESQRVTVQAGIRVEQVVEELALYGLTLQNFASIKEQQIGGFIQVGAHGTGARIPSVDEQVVSMKLVTPARGTLELSPETNSNLFYLSRCGLGALGVVAEVTLQCVPAHRLIEHTFVSSLNEVRKKHRKWLQENKHLRYMWIPDTEAVVVVQCNPVAVGKEPAQNKQKYTSDQRLEPVRALYREISKKYGPLEKEESITHGKSIAATDEKARMWTGMAAGSKHVLSEEELLQSSFTELRDRLLAFDPLNKEHVVKINKVEAEYWKRSEGYRVGWSHEILGFDCGGQQWVSEVCFPAGTVKKPDMKDIKYMEELLQIVKKEGIPAPAPIEQRWTGASKSTMSPASSEAADAVFSWVGIIMYLPPEDEAQRKATTSKFFEYRASTQKQLWDRYKAFEHWAKIEVVNDEEMQWIRERLRARYPVEAFSKARIELDPNNILSNSLMDKLFLRTPSE